MDKAPFIQALKTVIEADNVARKAAEGMIHEYAEKEPLAYFKALVDVFCNVQEPLVVQISGILLKNCINHENRFNQITNNLNEESRSIIQRDLLMRFGDSQLSKPTRRILTRVISQYVVKMSILKRSRAPVFGGGGFGGFGGAGGAGGAGGFGVAGGAAQNAPDRTSAWPELFQQLIQVASNDSQTEHLRSACLEVFGECAETMGDYSDFQEQFGPLLNIIASALRNAKTQPVFATHAASVIGPLVVSHSQGLFQQNTGRHSQALFGLAPLLLEAYTDICGDNKTVVMEDEHRFLDHNELFMEALESILSNDTEYTFFTTSSTFGQLSETIVSVAKRILRLFDNLAASSMNDELPTAALTKLNGIILQVLEENSKEVIKANKELVPNLFNIFVSMMDKGLNDRFLNVDEWKETYTKDVDLGDDADDEELALYYAGASGIDKLAEVVRGKQIESLVAPLLTEAASLTAAASSSSSDSYKNWKQLSRAIGILTYCYEGIQKFIKPKLDTIMSSLVVPNITHPHPFVRFSAIQCAAQLAVDSAPEFQQKYASTLLPLILPKLHKEHECPRLEELAGHFISSFFDALDTELSGDNDIEDAEEEAIAEVIRDKTKYLNSQFPMLFDITLEPLTQHEDATRKPSFVMIKQIRAVNDIVQVANTRVRPFAAKILEVVQVLVRKYHGVFVASIPDEDEKDSEETKKEKQNAFTNRCRTDATFRHDIYCLCYAIELATLTFSFLDKTAQDEDGDDDNKNEDLHQAAHDLTSFLADLLESGHLRARDHLLKYVLRGLNCMSEYLKDEITSLLPSFIPALIHYSELDCDVKFNGEDDDGNNNNNEFENISDSKTHEEHEEFGRVSLTRIQQGPNGAQRILRIPTQMIEVKDLATTILFSLCDNMKGHLYDYAPQIAACALPLLRFSANAEVRETGAMMISSLVKVINTANIAKDEQRTFAVASAKKKGETLSEEQLEAFKHVEEDEIKFALNNLAMMSYQPIGEGLSNENEERPRCRMIEALGNLIPHFPAGNDEINHSLPQMCEMVERTRDATVDSLRGLRDELTSQLEDLQQEIVVGGGEGGEEEMSEELVEEYESESHDLEQILHECVDVYTGLFKKNPEMMVQFFAQRVLRQAVDECQQALDLYKNYNEFVKKAHEQQKKGASGSKKKLPSGKKGIAAAIARQQQQNEPKQIPASQDPKYSHDYYTHFYALIGTFFEGVTAEKIIQVPEFLIHPMKILCESLPHLSHEAPLQAAAWSVSESLKLFSQIKKLDEKMGEQLLALVEQIAKAMIETFEARAQDFEGGEDGEDDFDAALTNLVGAYVRLVSFVDEDAKTLKTLKLDQLFEVVLAALPVDGDEVESKEFVYPELVNLLLEKPKNALLGSELAEADEEVKARRDSLIEVFQNMFGQGSFSPETEELLMKAFLNNKKEE